MPTLLTSCGPSCVAAGCSWMGQPTAQVSGVCFLWLQAALVADFVQLGGKLPPICPVDCCCCCCHLHLPGTGVLLHTLLMLPPYDGVQASRRV